MPGSVPPRILKTAAKIYNNDNNHHPHKTIAEKLGVSTRTAARYVQKARQLGLITRTTSARRARNPLVHGTTHGYSKHGCRCPKCTAANNTLCTRNRANRRKRAADATFTHGTSGYDNWGCRCPTCSAAKTADNRAHRDRRNREREDKDRRVREWMKQQARNSQDAMGNPHA